MDAHSPDIEEAWYAGEVDAVTRIADAELQRDPSAFAPKAWLGLVQWQVPARDTEVLYTVKLSPKMPEATLQFFV